MFPEPESLVTKSNCSPSDAVCGNLLRALAFLQLYEQALRASMQPGSLLFVACAVASFSLSYTRWSSVARVFAFSLQTAVVLYYFPQTANHHYLLWYSFLFLLIARENSLSYQRGIPLLVLFWSGVQKVAHGYYLNGAFFTYAIVHSERFRVMFAFLLGEKRLSRLLTSVETTGVYASDDPWLISISISVCFFEILAPILLLSGRGFARLILASIALFLLSAQLFAREWTFGAYMLLLLSLWWSDGRAQERPLNLTYRFCVLVSGVLLLLAVSGATEVSWY